MNYGKINSIVIDGWGSGWGKSLNFEEFTYHILANHIHSIQPECLVINHSCRPSFSVCFRKLIFIICFFVLFQN